MKRALLISIIVSCGLILGTGYIFNYINSTINNEHVYSLKKESKVETDAFSNIYVNVSAANIEIVKGNDYSVSYSLADKEYVKRTEVVNDGLYFETDRSYNWRPQKNEYNVVITVPENKELNEIKLHTIAGNITDNGSIFNKGNMKTIVGKITLNESKSDKIEASTTTGGLNIYKGNISKLKFNNKTGNIDIDGRFNKIEVDSISGKCKFNGIITDNAEFETISGGIDIESNISSFEAKSYGGVYWNGTKKGFSFSKVENESHMYIDSTSGKIRISEI